MGHDRKELLDELNIGLVVGEVALCSNVCQPGFGTGRGAEETNLAVNEGADLLLRLLGNAGVDVSEVGHSNCSTAQGRSEQGRE